MTANFRLNVIGTLGENNITQSRNTSIEVAQVTNSVYIIFSYRQRSPRILCRKLTFKKTADVNCAGKIAKGGLRPFEICVRKVLCLPFNLCDLIYTTRSLWVIGEDIVVNIKPYIEDVFKCDEEITSLDDNFMDSDDCNEFENQNFEYNLKFPNLERYIFTKNKFIVRCNLSVNGIIICDEDVVEKSWCLQLITTANSKVSPLLIIPVSPLGSDYDTKICKQGQVNAPKPVIFFMQSNDIKSIELKCSKDNIFCKLFGIDPSESLNSICIVGQHDGKILWSLCRLESEKYKDNASTDWKNLCDIKQPVKGIHFLESIGQITGYGFLLIIGTFGKVFLISTQKFFINSVAIKSDSVTLWAVTSYLNSDVANHFIFNDCILHSPNSKRLWTTVISTLQKSEKMELKFTSQSSELHGITSMVLLNKCEGFILLETQTGNVYLSQYEKEENVNNFSLPYLMNECLQHSMSIQKLQSTKLLQSRFFAAVSTFASLKYNSPLAKETFTYTLTEVDVQPKKYLLEINVKSLEKLNLDPDLWHIAASGYTCFEDNYTVISKTVPFKPGHSSLCLEVVDAALQPSFISAFPMLVEIGIILILPETWKAMDCFKLIAKKLPMYVRIQTFMIHELHSVKYGSKLLTTHNYSDNKENLLESIRDFTNKKPISHLFKVQFNEMQYFPQKFTFCISLPSIQNIVENVKDSELSQHILKFLLGKEFDFTEEKCLICRNIPISVEAVRSNNIIQVTVSAKSFDVLVGLRMAVSELFLTKQEDSNIRPSTCVSIPASINRKCEELSKKLMSMYGQDVESSDWDIRILQLYKDLRREISEKLPIL